MALVLIQVEILIKRMLNHFIDHKKNIFIVSFMGVFNILASFIGIRLMTQFIHPSTFGEYKVVMSAISVLVGFVSLPIIQYAMRAIHDSNKELSEFNHENDVKNLFNIYVIISSFLMFLIYIFLPNNLDFKNEYILLIPIIFFLTCNISYETSINISKNNQLKASLINFLNRLFIPIAIVFVVITIRENVFLILLSTIFAQLIILIYAKSQNKVMKNKDNYFWPKKKLIKGAFFYGWPLALIAIFSWIVNEGDRLILINYHGSAEVGFYSVAHGVIATPFIAASGIISQFLYPIFFRNSQSQSRINEIVTKLLPLNTLIAFLGVIFVFIFDEYIAFIAMSNEYQLGAKNLFIWIAIGYALFFISSSFDLAAYSNKKTSDMLIAYLIAAIAKLILSFLLIPKFAGFGAAIATMISLFFYLITMIVIYYLRILSMKKSQQKMSL